MAYHGPFLKGGKQNIVFIKNTCCFTSYYYIIISFQKNKLEPRIAW